MGCASVLSSAVAGLAVRHSILFSVLCTEKLQVLRRYFTVQKCVTFGFPKKVTWREFSRFLSALLQLIIFFVQRDIGFPSSTYSSKVVAAFAWWKDG